MAASSPACERTNASRSRAMNGLSGRDPLTHPLIRAAHRQRALLGGHLDRRLRHGVAADTHGGEGVASGRSPSARFAGSVRPPGNKSRPLLGGRTPRSPSEDGVGLARCARWLSVLPAIGWRACFGERLSEYRVCLPGLRHFCHGSRFHCGRSWSVVVDAAVVERVAT
jgi:hypothetical protein